MYEEPAAVHSSSGAAAGVLAADARIAAAVGRGVSVTGIAGAVGA